MVGIPGGAAGGLGGSKKRMQSYASSQMQTPPPDGSPLPVDGPVSRLAGGPGAPSGAPPPAPRPAVRHDEIPPPQQAPPPPRSEEEGADMSLYDMPLPEGRHVTWEDQDSPSSPSRQLPPLAATATAASEPQLIDRIRAMPAWAWILIVLGAVTLGVIIGVIVRRNNGAVFHPLAPR